MPGTTFREQAAETLDEASAVAARWHDAWQAASGQGYSDPEVALIETDRALQALQSALDRWGALAPPADALDRHREVSEALGDLVLRLEELEGALEARDVEKLRVVSQAAELSARHMGELREAFAASR